MIERSALFDGVEKPKLKLIGEDGNAFFIIGRARKAARNARWTTEQLEEYMTKVESGDYNNVLATTMTYFDEPRDDDENEDEEDEAEE